MTLLDLPVRPTVFELRERWERDIDSRSLQRIPGMRTKVINKINNNKVFFVD